MLPATKCRLPGLWAASLVLDGYAVVYSKHPWHKEVRKMAANGKANAGAVGGIVIALALAVAFKVAVDELSIIAEHGIDHWRRLRFGW
jgi:predicted butyrate kinase (DUF1464 family)